MEFLSKKQKLLVSGFINQNCFFQEGICMLSVLFKNKKSASPNSSSLHLNNKVNLKRLPKNPPIISGLSVFENLENLEKIELDPEECELLNLYSVPPSSPKSSECSLAEMPLLPYKLSPRSLSLLFNKTPVNSNNQLIDISQITPPSCNRSQH